MAHSIRVLWHYECHCRLVTRGSTASNEQQPTSLKRKDTRGATVLTIDRRPQHILVEVSRTSEIADDEQMCERDTFSREIQLEP